MSETNKPNRPKREDFFSDKQYLEAIRLYKRDRNRWLNTNKKGADIKIKVAKVKKERREYRKVKDSEYRKEEKRKKPHKSLDKF